MIAIDLMGGDFAPNVILQGALKAARDGYEICLFGPEAQAIALLDTYDSDWRTLCLTIVDTTQVIDMADEPVNAVRKKPDSSLVRAIKSLAQGQVSTVISAGNSGALMVAGFFIVGCEEGCERPAIAAMFPTQSGMVVGLDLGANTDCKPQNLVQFARLGSRFAKRMLRLKNPRVALLTNGEEDSKGSLLTKEVFSILSQDNEINFIGNKEPQDILRDKTDVFVCDGFTGNIFLKTFESVWEQRDSFFKQFLAEQVQAGFASEHLVSLLENQIDNTNVFKKMGGGLLLGIKKPIFVCHGAAQADDIVQAVKTAARYLDNGDVI